MCGVKLKDRLPSKELREREIRNREYNLGTTAKQAVTVRACVVKRRWLGEEKHGVWSRGSKPRGRPKMTWTEVVEKNCQARKLNKEDAIDSSRGRTLIKDVWWSGWVWGGECFFWYWLTLVLPDKGPLNGCVCALIYLDKIKDYSLCGIVGQLFADNDVHCILYSTHQCQTMELNLYSMNLLAHDFISIVL